MNDIDTLRLCVEELERVSLLWRTSLLVAFLTGSVCSVLGYAIGRRR